MHKQPSVILATSFHLEHPVFIFQKIQNEGGQEILRVHKGIFESSLRQNGNNFPSHSFLPPLPPHAAVFSISFCFVFDLLVKVRKHHPPNCEHLHSCRCEGRHIEGSGNSLLIYNTNTHHIQKKQPVLIAHAVAEGHVRNATCSGKGGYGCFISEKGGNA